jgi:hypothetical protein
MATGEPVADAAVCHLTTAVSASESLPLMEERVSMIVVAWQKWFRTAAVPGDQSRGFVRLQ